MRDVPNSASDVAAFALASYADARFWRLGFRDSGASRRAIVLGRPSRSEGTERVLHERPEVANHQLPYAKVSSASPRERRFCLTLLRLGHRKKDAVRMKSLIEGHQNEYYRSGGQSAAPGAPVGPIVPGPVAPRPSGR